MRTFLDGYGRLWRTNGARGRSRTADTAIFSRMLYQLSYPGTFLRTRNEARLLMACAGLVQHLRINPLQGVPHRNARARGSVRRATK